MELWQSLEPHVQAYQGARRQEHGATGVAELFDEEKFTTLLANNRSAEALDMMLRHRGARVHFENGALDNASRENSG